MSEGPMHAAIERLHQQACERREHYRELARTAGTSGRRATATVKAGYYTKIAAKLAEASRLSERAP
jgi:aconitase B